MKPSNFDNLNLSRLLVIAVICFIMGIIAGYHTNFSYKFPLGVLFFFISLWVFAFKYGSKSSQILLLLVTIILSGIFWVDYQEADNYLLEEWTGEKVKIEGIIGVNGSKNVQEVKVIKINDRIVESQSTIAVFLHKVDSQNYKWGDKVFFSGVLEKMLPAINPGGFSEREYWRQKGVVYKLRVFEKGSIEQDGHFIGLHISNLRNKIYDLIVPNLPQQEAGIILGLLLGDKENMDDSFYEAAQKMGVSHIFAVSGLHVGIALAFYLALTKHLKLSDAFAFTGAVFLLGVYSLVTGLTPSVMRASIMALVSLAAVKLLRFKDFYTFLAFAALVILLINPLALFTIGFQLSFAAAWGLVYLIPLAKEIVCFLPEKFRVFLAVPLAAQLATLPLTIYYFNTLSLLAPFYNLLIVPIVSLLIPMLFGAFFLSLLSIQLAQPFILFSGGLVYGISVFISFLQKSLWAGYFVMATPPMVLVFGYYILLVAAKEVEKIKKNLSVEYRLLAGILLVFFLLYLVSPKTVPFQVTFLDVGQGDGAIIQTPARQYVVIDGGPGTSAIRGYLRHKGINKISLAILSHPDADHINGLYHVISEYETEKLLVPPDVGESEQFDKLKTLAYSKKVKLIEGKPGMILKMPGEVLLRVLFPDLNRNLNWDINNASLVVNLTYQNQDFLFSGDIDSTIMYQLLPSLKEIEVIKIPHHGSRGSFTQDFYHNLKPEYAIISAGRGNRYGHPHPEVIQGLGEAGINIFRTDQHGAVIIKARENKLEFSTMFTENSYK